MEIRCKFEDISIYTCWIAEDQCPIVKPHEEIADFISENQEKERNFNLVEKLCTSKNIILYVPTNVHEFFPYLKCLKLQNCHLREIHRRDIGMLEHLEQINLDGNDLRMLPDDLFLGKYKLRWIYFSNNRLEFLSSKMFEPIRGNDLKALDFSGNLKIDIKLTIKLSMEKECNKLDLGELISAIDKNCRSPDQRIVNSLEILAEKLEVLYFTGRFSDVILRVHDKEFKVHRNILASQSIIFEEIFNKNFDERVVEIKNVKNFDSQTFSTFLNFFYSGRQKNCIVMELFELASLFEVLQLMEDCKAQMLASLNESNMLEIYNLGHNHNLYEITREAFEKIIHYHPEIRDVSMYSSDKVNEIVKAKRHFEKLLRDVRRLC